ncbi:Serine/threonine-protein kinase HT1 [Leucoagaricus sp. SymC.cos]|nr:Serine/threonine-protein kinase HT1 [Leucoagaricus sp. SymC.cos]
METSQTVEVRPLKRSDPLTIQDKFLVQYLGWYACPGDGVPLQRDHHGWLHWFNNQSPDMKHPYVDLFSDVSSYSPSELYAVPGFTTNDDQQTFLFSSRNPITVQRYRVFNVSVSDVALADVLEKDWKNLVYEKGVLNSPNYLRENGKPVISLSHLGWLNAGHTPALVRSIVAMFRRITPGGAYIIAYLPTCWRSSEVDADPNPELLDVWLNEFDAICPNISTANGERMKADVDFIRKRLEGGQRTIDYIPSVYPGQSKNLLPQSDKCKFMALDEDGYDLPSDWYMRICGLAAEALHDKRKVSKMFPPKDLEDYWSMALEPKTSNTLTTLRTPKVLQVLRDLWKSGSSVVPQASERFAPGELDRLGLRLLQFPVIRQRLLSARGQKAEMILDGMQKVLDYEDLSEVTRRSIVVAMLRLSKASATHPKCMTLQGIKVELKRVAAGGFGEVFRGKHGKQSVCLKVAHVYQDSNVHQLTAAFSKEAILWSQLSHPNVLPFYGIYCPDGNQVALVSPWMEEGNICDYLKRNPAVPRLPLVLDILEGLSYLHQNSVVHSDLKGDFYVQLEDYLRVDLGGVEGGGKVTIGREVKIRSIMELVEKACAPHFITGISRASFLSDPTLRLITKSSAALNLLDLALEHLDIAVDNESKLEVDNVVKVCGAKLCKLDSARAPKEKARILVDVHQLIVDGLSKLPPIRLMSPEESKALKEQQVALIKQKIGYKHQNQTEVETSGEVVCMKEKRRN